MRFDETRDNLTDTENQIREADAHEDTRDVWAGTDIYIDEGDAREDGPTWTECQCEHCTEFSEAEAEYIRDSRHIRLVDEPHEEYEDGANGYEDDPSYEEYQTYIEGMGW
tara:strand:+ start:151 stop:480 length:330 start_codon:yes stop_codon:yes gene_type:complete